MASSLCTHEIAIVYDEGDAPGALRLQQWLRRDGFRAGIVRSNHSLSSEMARRVLRYRVPAASGRAAEQTAFEDGFDLFFTDDVCGTALDPAVYQALRANLAQYSEQGPISSDQLRDVTRRSYDSIATQFTDVWFDELPTEALDTFERFLPRGASILDAGCGPGHHARHFRRRGFDPAGLDFSRGMVDIARAKNDHISFIHGDLMTHALPPDRFDGVWSAVALNHVPREELPRALGNLLRTLKPGGVIGLNFQVGRPSEVVSRGYDQRFFEYPPDERAIAAAIRSLGVRVLAMHSAIVTRNTHGLPLAMRFATVVGRRIA